MTMKQRNSIKHRALVAGIALMMVGLARAQGAASGSTDIYHTDFQAAYASVQASSAPIAQLAPSGSTDIWRNEFARSFGAVGANRADTYASAGRGSTDIYSTNFQNVYM
jgi:hypothetical protein